MTNDDSGDRSAVIVIALITPLHTSILDPMPKVIVTDSTGDAIKLFTYYPDEISFTEEEFVGLTLDQARSLKFAKDRTYLQS